MGYEISPERRKRRAKGRKRQEEYWARKAGPVIVKAICGACGAYPCKCRRSAQVK